MIKKKKKKKKTTLLASRSQASSVQNYEKRNAYRLSHSVYSISFLQPKQTKIETETRKWGGAETNIYKGRGGFRTGGGQGLKSFQRHTRKSRDCCERLLKVGAQKEKSIAIVKAPVFLEIQK